MDPLQILNDKLPQDIIDNIRLYVVNEIAYQAINKYYNHLYKKKELYEEFVCVNYIYPNCKCNNFPDNGRYKMYKRKDCNDCFIFDSTFTYMPEDFRICIWDNNQFKKIRYYPNYEKSEEYYDEDEDEDEEYYEYDY